MQSVESGVVLLVDDNAATLKSLAKFLERSGFQVLTAGTGEEAMSILESSVVRPSFVVLDQVLDGRIDGGTRAVRRISEICPDILIVMYTADPQIEEVEKWRAIHAGAHRFILKGSADELRRDFSEAVQDMHDLQELTHEIGEIASGRLSMFSALVGLDVRLTIVDKEYRVWFSTDSDAGDRVDIGGLTSPCWVFFHGLPVDSGPCRGCTIKAAIESGQMRSRTLLSRSRGGGLEWIRNDTIPIFIKHKDGSRRVIAARESCQRLGEAMGGLNQSERLQCLADSIVDAGFRAVRIYKAIDERRIKCVAAKTSFSQHEDDAYRDKIQEFETSFEQNKYFQKAFSEKVGTLNLLWDEKIGKDSEMVFEVGLQPPWIDLPIWQGENLAGWIGADLPEESDEAAAQNALEELRIYADEVLRVLLWRRTSDVADPFSRSVLGLARLELTRAQDALDAIVAIMTLIRNLVEERGEVLDVRIRIKENGVLKILRRLSPESRIVDEDIEEEDRESWAAFVVRYRHPLYVNDRKEYAERVSQEENLPRGRHGGGRSAIAMLPLEVQGFCFGSLHVECKSVLDWENSGLKKPLGELAGVAAILLRDIVTTRRLAEAKAAVENELKEAFGSVHGVKGPIQAVRSAFELIIELFEAGRLDQAALSEVAEAGRQSILRIEKLSAQLLRLTRTTERTRERVSPVQILRQIIADWRRLYSETVVVDDLQSSECLVEANIEEFRDILEELFSNSMSAGARGVRIKCEMLGDSCVVRFEDDGRGVLEEKVERIFERWYSEFPGGNGLGLALVRAVAARMGGQVWAEPLDRGLAVVMKLPTVG